MIAIPVIGCQGVVSLVSESRRVIVQGVYELYEKEHTTEWKGDKRLCRLVFIGESLMTTWSL